MVSVKVNHVFTIFTDNKPPLSVKVSSYPLMQYGKQEKKGGKKGKSKDRTVEGWHANDKWRIHQEDQRVMKCGHTKKVRIRLRKTWDCKTKENRYTNCSWRTKTGEQELFYNWGTSSIWDYFNFPKFLFPTSFTGNGTWNSSMEFWISWLTWKRSRTSHISQKSLWSHMPLVVIFVPGFFTVF